MLARVAPLGEGGRPAVRGRRVRCGPPPRILGPGLRGGRTRRRAGLALSTGLPLPAGVPASGLALSAGLPLSTGVRVSGLALSTGLPLSAGLAAVPLPGWPGLSARLLASGDEAGPWWLRSAARD